MNGVDQQKTMGAFDTMFEICTSQVVNMYPVSFSGNWTAVSNFCSLLTTVVVSNHKTSGVLDFEGITPVDVGWWVNGVFCTAVACLTVFLNSISIWVFTRRSGRSPTHLLLAIVSGLDLLTCVFQVPLQVHVYLRRGYRLLPTRAWCDVYHYMYNFVPATLHSTAFLLNMCLSVQRCVGIKDIQRFRLKAVCSYKGTLISIALCVTASALVHALYPITIGVEKVEAIGKEMMETGKLRLVESCKVSPRYPDAYNALMSAYIWARVVLLQTIPAVVLGVCNTFLIIASFRVYSYRRRLIGKLGGISSLRSACAPNVEAFKRFGKDGEYGEDIKNQEPMEESSLANAGPDTTKLNRRQSHLQEITEDKNELQLNNVNVSSRREGACSGCYDNGKIQESSTTCMDRFEANKNTGCQDFGQDIENNSVTCWKFLRENVLSPKCNRNDSKHCILTCQEQDQNDYSNLNIDQCLNFNQHECAKNFGVSVIDMNVSRAGWTYDHGEILNLSNISIDLQPFYESTHADSVFSARYENKMCPRNFDYGRNTTQGAEGSFLSNLGCLSVVGDHFRYLEEDTVSLPVIKLCPQKCFSKYMQKHSPRYSLNKFKLKSFSTWPFSKNNDFTTSETEKTVATEIKPPSSCTNYLTETGSKHNQNSIRDITQHTNSQPNVNHTTGVITDRDRKSESHFETQKASAAYPNNGELRSTIMLVLVTSLTLLAEVFVIIMLIFQFLDSIALKQKKFISTSELAVMFALSNLVTLLTFPLNFFIFCGLSYSFRDALRHRVKTMLAVVKKLLRLS